MRRMYQTEWQDIQFADIFKLSSTELAGPEFYQAFYDEFFRRYRGWEQLSPAWRESKELWARFVLSRYKAGGRVLSVGCGLGAIEHYMHSQNQQLELFIHDVAPSAWRWIGAEFAEERKFLGMIPACLPDGIRFKLIYLAAVDYALDDGSLVALLAALRLCLGNGGGQCLLISASFQDTPVTIKERALSLARELKTRSEPVLKICGLRSHGQFWGWSRTQKDYQSLMRRADFHAIEDGFIDPDKRTHYWIAGHCS